jgi:hypothetical protein
MTLAACFRVRRDQLGFGAPSMHFHIHVDHDLRVKATEGTWEKWNASVVVPWVIIAQIQLAKAESLFGVGVKLAALPLGIERDEDDYAEAVTAALTDIDRLTGSGFAVDFVKAEDEDEGEDEEDA